MYECNAPKHSLLDHLDVYIDEYNRTDSELILKHIMQFAIYELNQTGNDYTADDVTEKVNMYLIDRAIASLSKKGLLEVEFTESGEIMYSLTEQGEKYAKGIVSMPNDGSAG